MRCGKIARRSFLAAAASAAASTIAPASAQIFVTPNPAPANPQFLRQLTIGINVTLTGPLQKYGQEIVRGVQAAVDEANLYTPSALNVWAWRAFDDQNNTALGRSNVSAAAADGTILAMIGNLTAPMTLDALSQYANQNFAVIVPTLTADAITRRGFHNVYRLPASDSSSGQLFASTALEKHHGVACIAVALDGDYGYDVARAFVQQAKADHHNADVLLFPQGKTDPASAARTVLDRNPAYVFLAGKTADLGPVAEALRLANYSGDFGASDGFYNPDTIDRYARILDGALVASSMPPLERVPSAVYLLNDFERKVGQVTAFSAYAYGAAQLIMAAQRRANATSRFSLLTSMQQGGTFTTLVGQYRFNVSGDPLIPDIYLYSVHKEGFKYERPAIRTGFVI
ncbi:MAG TPA: branched-chain amino acid ABC transporter substrate-binding protein [Candidatus Baltobacteraceae bacterium]|jgi:branched-chain amino acid transport system substrate-binding protein|nr:branched-chain amino acid ABC transporter substrate-binding protein [Candidatus Baltobacteraceae bacterium]